MWWSKMIKFHKMQMLSKYKYLKSVLKNDTWLNKLYIYIPLLFTIFPAVS